MRPKLTYANVMSTLCFFLLLGGGAYAAGHLGKNTVGTKQLKKNSVTTAKIKKEAVTSAKIKLSSLGTVPNAANAQALGGLSASQISEAAKLRCPGGTTSLAGIICIEDTERKPPANLTVAMVECAKSNRRLPSMGELTTFGIQNFNEAPNPEWVEPEYQNGATRGGDIVSAWGPDNMTVAFQESSTTHRYRCVTTPSN